MSRLIEELSWDSAILHKKIGQVKIYSFSPEMIPELLEEAKEQRFDYMIFKARKYDEPSVRALINCGFYLSDIGVTLSADITNTNLVQKLQKIEYSEPICNPTLTDIPDLKSISKSLFLESRFYNDPFFSMEDAERLFGAWIENSVKGEVADLVCHIPHKGFISCKQASDQKGRICLLGISEEFRGKGLGTNLLCEAIKWFRQRGIVLVDVRTQLRNISGINFYIKRGFSMNQYDIILAKTM